MIGVQLRSYDSHAGKTAGWLMRVRERRTQRPTDDVGCGRCGPQDAITLRAPPGRRCGLGAHVAGGGAAAVACSDSHQRHEQRACIAADKEGPQQPPSRDVHHHFPCGAFAHVLATGMPRASEVDAMCPQGRRKL
jgi:hypothetical protein